MSREWFEKEKNNLFYEEAAGNSDQSEFIQNCANLDLNSKYFRFRAYAKYFSTWTHFFHD